MKTFTIGRHPDNNIVLPPNEKTSRLHAKLYISKINGLESYCLVNIGRNGTKISGATSQKPIELKEEDEKANITHDSKIEFAGCKRVYTLDDLLIEAEYIKNPLDFSEEFDNLVNLWKEYQGSLSSRERQIVKYKEKRRRIESKIRLALFGFSGILLFGVLIYNNFDASKIVDNPKSLLFSFLPLLSLFSKANQWIADKILPKLDHEGKDMAFKDKWRCPNPNCKEEEAYSEFRHPRGLKDPDELRRQIKCGKCKAIWVK